MDGSLVRNSLLLLFIFLTSISFSQIRIYSNELSFETIEMEHVKSILDSTQFNKEFEIYQLLNKDSLLLMQGKLNKLGEKTAHWILYDSSARKRIQCEFLSDSLVGEYFFFERGVLRVSKHFKSKQEKVKEYHSNGLLSKSYQIKNGYLFGKYVTYSFSGLKTTKGKYKKTKTVSTDLSSRFLGVKDGWWYQYKDGKEYSTKTKYKNGREIKHFGNWF